MADSKRFIARTPARYTGAGEEPQKIDPRQVRHTEKVRSVINALTAREIIVKAGVDDWDLDIAALTGIASGTYTPTLTNVANLGASTAFACQYVRVGSVVTVSGKVAVDPTAPAAATELGISLPIASAFATEQQCGGTAFCPAIAGQGAAILADATNDRAAMRWVASDITNQTMAFSFTYQIV